MDAVAGRLLGDVDAVGDTLAGSRVGPYRLVEVLATGRERVAKALAGEPAVAAQWLDRMQYLWLAG